MPPPYLYPCTDIGLGYAILRINYCKVIYMFFIDL